MSAILEAIQQLAAIGAIAALAVLVGMAMDRPRRNRRVRTIPPRYGFRDCNGPVRVRK